MNYIKCDFCDAPEAEELADKYRNKPYVKLRPSCRESAHSYFYITNRNPCEDAIERMEQWEEEQRRKREEENRWW